MHAYQTENKINTAGTSKARYTNLFLIKIKTRDIEKVRVQSTAKGIQPEEALKFLESEKGNCQKKILVLGACAT